MPDNITPLDLAQRLAAGVECPHCIDGKVPATGIPSDGYDRCHPCNGEGVERYPQEAGFPHWYYDLSGELCVGTKLPRSIAAPHVTDAILWLLGTEAWCRKFGQCTVIIESKVAWWIDNAAGPLPGINACLPSDLLRAMLAAIKEATA